jgi:cell division protease FtsH
MTMQRDGTNTPAGEDRPTTNRSDEQRRASGPGERSTMPPARSWLWFALILLANVLIVRFLLPGPEAPVEVPYTFFKEQVRAGNVEAIYSQGDTVEGRFEEPVTYPPKGEGGSQPGSEPSSTSKNFTTVLPSFVDPGLEELLISNGVEISAEPIQEGGGLWQTLLFAFGPALLLIGGYIWLYRRAQRQGGGMGGAFTSVGRSRARRYDQEQETKVTFEDVAGIEEAENELVEIVDFLKDPEKYTRLGGAAPKGVLLVGAPGTGKTLLARAVAGEAGVPFFSLSASEFVELFVGVGASRVRDLFKQARENAPAIIFIDELDSIGRSRGQTAIGGSSEQEQTLNQILTEMDGFSSKEGVIVLAATNQPDVLDKALLRPGRFDRRVVVNLPDKVGREAILEVHTRSVPLARGVDLEELAASTPGLSGADLRNLVNEAALLAARREQEEVVYGTRTTGAESDIEQATDLARRMVTRWGMSEKLGTVELAPRDNPYLGGSGGYGGEKPYSEETARTIDAEVWRIIDESYLDARRLLTEHRKELEALAQALLQRETLDEQEILEVTELAPAPPLENRKIAASSSNFRRDGR